MFPIVLAVVPALRCRAEGRPGGGRKVEEVVAAELQEIDREAGPAGATEGAGRGEVARRADRARARRRVTRILKAWAEARVYGADAEVRTGPGEAETSVRAGKTSANGRARRGKRRRCRGPSACAPAAWVPGYSGPVLHSISPCTPNSAPAAGQARQDDVDVSPSGLTLRHPPAVHLHGAPLVLPRGEAEQGQRFEAVLDQPVVGLLTS